MKTDLAAMRDAGFTVVRTYTLPPDDLIDLAADWDLHLLAGIHWSDWRYLVGASRRQARDVAREARSEVRRAARRLAGCAEVLALCLGNEVPADAVRWVGTSRVAGLIAELAEVVREEDPGRLVTYANYPTAEYVPLDNLDFLTFNVFLEREPDLRRYLTRLHHLAGDRPLVLGELGLDAGGPGGEQAQAASLDRQLGCALERGVAGTCVFSWTDEWWVGGAAVEGWHFGLTRSDRSARPALAVARGWNARTVADLLPAGQWPTMSVVICGYNAAATLDECLRHTCALDYPGLDIVVVDDGSTDGMAEVAACHPRARLVRIDHAGLSVARNAGLAAATGELIAYLDADAYPSPEWPYYLALGIGGVGSQRRRLAGSGGPNVAPPSDPIGAQQVARAPGGPVHVLLADDRAEHVPGCNMAFRRTALVAVGGFEPVYTAAGDDVDICWKVLDRGWEIGFHPAALVWHHRRPGARAYLRQQRGYGRAEALVAARHPERFNALGAARWQGRIYNPVLRLQGRQRIYRGAFGAAAFQSVYRSASTGLDVAHQLGVPLVVALVASGPLAALSPYLGLPAVGAAGLLGVLAVLDISRATPPHTLRRGRLRFRLGVAWLCLAQPLVRAWGRLHASRAALRDLPASPGLVGPVRTLPGGVLLIGAAGPREAVARAIVAAVRRAGVPVLAPTGWEDWDALILGSLLTSGALVTSGHVAGTVQVRVRRRLRAGRVTAALGVVAIAGLVQPVLGAGVLAVALAEAARGYLRTGRRLRRVIEGVVTQPDVVQV